MVSVSIEVSRGSTCYRISIRAASIRRALEIAGAGKPGWNLKILTPLEPETFFGGKPASEARSVAGSEAA